MMSSQHIPISRTVNNENVITVNPEQATSFNAMQRNMEDELERRRKDWEREVERMQQDFFHLKSDDDPENHNVSIKLGSSPGRGVGTSVIDINNAKTLYQEKPDGSRSYRLRFDLTGFEPHEIRVKAEGQKLHVNAWKELDHGTGHKSTKQFSRQIDVPENVNPDRLVAVMNSDGFLALEAPVEEVAIPVQTTTTDTPLLSPPQYFSVVRTRKSPPSSPRVSGVTSSLSRYGTGGPMIVSVNDTRKLSMAVEIGPEFKPQDVVVKLVGTKLQVQAKREETTGGRTSKREFSREFDLPERIEESSLRAMLGHTGRLVIGASVYANKLHSDAINSVLRDMPIDGRACRIVII